MSGHQRHNVACALLDVLGDRVTKLTVKGGTTIFEQGDEDDRLFILISGGLEVSVLSSEGRKLTVSLIRDTSIFGEVAVFDPGPRTASVRATEPSDLVYIRQSNLLSAMERDPAVGLYLFRLAGSRLRGVIDQLSEQVFLSPSARLAARLIHLADGPNDSGSMIRISQAELADMVGVTREAVSKTVSRWKRDNIVEVGRGTIRILDMGAIGAQASPDLI